MTVWIGLKSSKATSTLQQDGRINNSYTEVYLYRTNAGTRPTFADIIADIGVYPGAPYADDTNATAGNAEIEHLSTRPPHCAAEVTITWATNNPVPSNTDPATQADPTTRRNLWSITANLQTTYITKDKDGKLIVNAVGQPFDGGVPTSIIEGVAVAKRNKSASGYDKGLVMRYSGRLNSDTYLGAAPGTLQVMIASEENYEGSFHWWAETFQFLYNPLGHQPRPVDAGFYQASTVAGVVVPITVGDLSDPQTNDATRVTEPEPLFNSTTAVSGHPAGTVVPYSMRPDSCSHVDVQHFDTLNFASTFGL